MFRVVSDDAEDVTPDSRESEALAEVFVVVWARDDMPDAGPVGVEGGWMTLEFALGVLLLTSPLEFVPTAVEKLVCLDIELVGVLLVALTGGLPLAVDIPDRGTPGAVVVAVVDVDAIDPKTPDDPFCPLVVTPCDVCVLV